MSNDGKGLPRLLISVIDEDPLRARSDARELLTEVSATDPAASLRLPSAGPPASTDKGGDVSEGVGLVLSAGSFAAACVQVWLAKIPQRTIIATRPDGATLRITGREAREDDARLERFLAEGSLPSDGSITHGAAGAGRHLHGGLIESAKQRSIRPFDRRLRV